MRVVDIIDKKKKNKELTKAEIEFLLQTNIFEGLLPLWIIKEKIDIIVSIVVNKSASKSCFTKL